MTLETLGRTGASSSLISIQVSSSRKLFSIKQSNRRNCTLQQVIRDLSVVMDHGPHLPLRHQVPGLHHQLHTGRQVQLVLRVTPPGTQGLERVSSGIIIIIIIVIIIILIIIIPFVKSID